MTDYLLSLGVQISVLILAALAVVAALRRWSSALRHWVLAAAIACAACLPVLQILVPSWALDVGPRTAATQAIPSSPSTPTVGTGPSRETSLASTSRAAPAAQEPNRPMPVVRLIPLVWAIGVTVGLALLAAGLARLAWLARRARPLTHPTWVRVAAEVSQDLGVRRPVELLHADHPSIVAAWGWIRPRIMVPRSAAEWPADDVAIVLRHEMAHIARGDWIVQMVAEVLRALNWFNPLLWMASRGLRSESERACDDVVLEWGVGGSDYAARLVALARTLNAHGRWSPAFPAPAMARPSSLERRVAAMMNTKLSRAPITIAARTAIAGLALAVTLPVAGLAVFAQAPSSFSGSVLDPTSRVVPNARVVLTNGQTQARIEVVSDSAGHFEFVGLPAGEYVMEARLPGFATVRGTVTVTPRGMQRDLYMQLGSIQEMVVVKIGDQPRAQSGGATQPPDMPARGLLPRSPCTEPPVTGGNVLPPRKVSNVFPEYPEHLRADKVAGLVVVEGVVGKDGSVHDLRVVEAPHPDLGRAVVEAVSRWTFEATLLNCEPVDVKISVTTRFEF